MAKINILWLFQVSTINFNGITQQKNKQIENKETVRAIHYPIYPSLFPNY